MQTRQAPPYDTDLTTYITIMDNHTNPTAACGNHTSRTQGGASSDDAGHSAFCTGGPSHISIANVGQLNIVHKATTVANNYYSGSRESGADDDDNDDNDIFANNVIYDGKSVLIPSNLIPTEKSDITEEHAKKWFKYVRYLDPDVKDEAEKAGLIAEFNYEYTESRGRSFQNLLQTINADLLTEGKRAFTNYIVKNCAGAGWRQNGVPITCIEHVGKVLGSDEMKKAFAMDPFWPLRETYKYIHGDVDGVFTTTVLPTALLEWSRKRSAPFHFYFSQYHKEGNKKPRSISHNVIKIATRGHEGIKKNIQQWEEKNFGMSVRLKSPNKKSSSKEQNYWCVPMSTITDDDRKKVYIRVRKSAPFTDKEPDEKKLREELTKGKLKLQSNYILDLACATIKHNISQHDLLTAIVEAREVLSSVVPKLPKYEVSNLFLCMTL